MSTTQEHLLIKDIKDNILLLKNGGGALVLQVSAVNFGLLSDLEQMAIISSFAQMLNSLSFSIQIVVYSERLNISSYLNLLDKAQEAQQNPLLIRMMNSYRQFIQTTIRENEVLDKKFYVVIPLYAIELGLTAAKENLQQKIKTVLWPRRDQIIRQLNRVGLKATQLTNQQLIELFYNIYNGQFVQNVTLKPSQEPIEITLKPPQPAQQPIPTTPPVYQPSLGPIQPFRPSQAAAPKSHPFVVEELEG